MEIVFLQSGIKCDGNSIYDSPLGGTESAMIYMARQLALQGHRVSVFCVARSEGIIDGVNYYDKSKFERYASLHTIDVLIAIRQLFTLLVKRWAKCQIYLTPDANDQPHYNHAVMLDVDTPNQTHKVCLYTIELIQKNCDALFFVGHWQAELFTQAYHLDPSKVFVAYNGVDEDIFHSDKSFHQREAQMVYCSTPFRGLKQLLQFFPQIRQKVPHARLAVLSGMQIYGCSLEYDQSRYGDIYELADQPGVTMHGPLAKPEMASILSQSRLLAYPNTFKETFCIAALEAQASGLPVVSSNLAAMKERVCHKIDGFLIDGNPNETAYQNLFVDHCVQLLTNETLWARMSKNALEKTTKFHYSNLVERWLKKITEIYVSKQENLSTDLFIPQPLSTEIGEDPIKITFSTRSLYQILCQKAQEEGYVQIASKYNQLSVISESNNSLEVSK